MNSGLELAGVYRQRQPGPPNPPTQLPTQNSYPWYSVPPILFYYGGEKGIRKLEGLTEPASCRFVIAKQPQRCHRCRGSFAYVALRGNQLRTQRQRANHESVNHPRQSVERVFECADPDVLVGQRRLIRYIGT